MKTPQSVPTVADLRAEVRRLRAEVQRSKPAPEVSGADWLKAHTPQPQQAWNEALQSDRNSKRDAGMRKAADLLQENSDAYPHDGHGTRALADHSGLSLEDARSVFSAHLQHINDLRGKHEDVERTRLLARAKPIAHQFVRAAVKNGLDVAAKQLATKAQVSLSIARQAIEECTDEMDGQYS